MHAKSDFCRWCGASIPPRSGEATCERCTPWRALWWSIRAFFRDLPQRSCPKCCAAIIRMKLARPGDICQACKFDQL